ncbi:hypothetical protein [Pusillimonas sp.]|uniref:hypothetical protein n=1 Tax=Pusillimonas sp. TaxID=3040095 RepID=UPI0029BD0D4B|nr:hypothetical protein [Pusillimonas sp.]MDX3893357.1 hypothetical protein [Pusillimonas sp.]
MDRHGLEPRLVQRYIQDTRVLPNRKALAGLLGSIPLLSSGILELPMLRALKNSAVGAFGGHFWGPDIDNEANRNLDAHDSATSPSAALFCI